MSELLPGMMQDDFQLTLQPHAAPDAERATDGAEVVTLTPRQAVERASHAELAARRPPRPRARDAGRGAG